MSIILKQAITGRAAWKGGDFARDDSWVHRLTPDQVAVLDAALATLKARGKRFPGFAAEDFPIDAALAARLSAHAEELENGRGFLLMRGLPLERYSNEEMQAVCYGIGLHMGIPVRQNPKGDLLGEVMAVGDIHDKNTRVYQTNLYLPYHSDPSDVVGLMCVRKAPQGGLSGLVSVAAIYNEILAHHPEYLGLYYRLWYFAHLCEPQPSLSPIFSFHQGKLSCRYLRQYIELGHEIRGLPLSKVEIEALDLFDSVMHDPAMRIDMMLEPGDLQFANNYAVLHSRTDFVDHTDPALRRRMLRLWLKMPNARVLAPEFPGRNGFPAPGESLAAT
ncbi:MAG: hypothetical protein RL014_1276 [Pseudomonadota bacterium]|jgi:hypothetical protein